MNRIYPKRKKAPFYCASMEQQRIQCKRAGAQIDHIAPHGSGNTVPYIDVSVQPGSQIIPQKSITVLRSKHFL